LLSRPDIEKAIRAKHLRFAPEIDLGRIKQVSVDMPLGRQFTEFLPPPDHIHAVRMSDSIWEAPGIWDRKEQDEYVLRPGQFVLAQTQERVCLPNYLSGLIEGRSSYARLGISVHITAPKIDPGFDGTITLEMFNHGKLGVVLRAGIDAPAQLLLFKVSRPHK
jgi:dCTP deaminase